MSGRAEVAKIRSGMVETGFSQAREPGRSAMRDTSGSRCAWIPFWIAARAQSCLQVYCPWFKLTGQDVVDSWISSNLIISTWDYLIHSCFWSHSVTFMQCTITQHPLCLITHSMTPFTQGQQLGWWGKGMGQAPYKSYVCTIAMRRHGWIYMTN